MKFGKLAGKATRDKLDRSNKERRDFKKKYPL